MNGDAETLAEAIEKFLHEYRMQYRTPATSRVRANAPMQGPVGHLSHALNNYRLSRHKQEPSA